MTTNTRQSHHRELVIEIEHKFPATPEQVFRRWTNADALARWFAPPGYITVFSEADPRPGGQWRLDFRADTGQHVYTEQGIFHQVEPFAWLMLTLSQIDGDHVNPETLVTVALDDIGTAEMPRTLMRFTQSGYRSSALRDDNERGWRGCFTVLAHDLTDGESS